MKVWKQGTVPINFPQPYRPGCRLGLLIFLALLFFSPNAFPQQSGACDSLLAAAWEKFSRAYFEEAKALVEACLGKNAITREDTLDVYLLFALIAFTRDEDLARATQHINALLAVEPAYTLQREVPKKFREFFEEIKKTQAATATPESISRIDSTGAGRDTSGQQPPPGKPAADSLIIFPETTILDWLTINLGLASNFGDSSSQNPPLLAYFRFSLEFAELEFSTIEIINQFPQQRTQLPTLAFKLRILPEGNWPGLAMIGRTSIQFWEDDYPKGLKSLLLLASKTFGPAHLQTGINGSILSASVSGSNAAITDTSENRITAFAAAHLRAKSIAMLLITLDAIPEYLYLDSQLQTPDVRYSLTVIARAFPLPWLALDIGGKWYFKKKIDPEKLTNEDIFGNTIRIHIGVNVGLSLTRIFPGLRRL